MRDIKFRGWYIYGDKMLEIQRINFKTNKVLPYSWNIPHDGRSFEIMQYTGFKDKKGVEIYEGDILKMDKGSAYALRTVFSVKGGFAIECLDSDYGMYGSKDVYVPVEGLADEQTTGYIESCSEVVGNIYENKDLVVS